MPQVVADEFHETVNCRNGMAASADQAAIDASGLYPFGTLTEPGMTKAENYTVSDINLENSIKFAPYRV